MTRLLVRGLAQLATPAAAGGLPRRGRELGAVDVLEDAFVLCDEGRIEAVGRMRDLGRLGERLAGVQELDGSGLCAVPGLVDCHTHPAFGGDRVDEFSLRAGGASYEELHAAGGGILSTVSATRALGADGLRDRVARHAGWMLRHGTTTWEGKSGYGLDRDTELASLRAVAAAGGSPTWLGAHAVPPEFEGRRRVPRLRARRGAARRRAARRGGRRLSRARRIRRRRRRGGFSRRARRPGLALRLHGDQFTESGAIPLAVDLGARSVDHLEATGAEGVAALAGSGVVGVLLPASALFLDRPMPPARALADAGAAIALATDFNPGSAFTTSLPLVCSLACTQLHLSPAEALTAVTVNAAHVLGAAERVGRIAPGLDANLVLLDAPDWRYLAYHLAGEIVAVVVKDGQVLSGANLSI